MVLRLLYCSLFHLVFPFFLGRLSWPGKTKRQKQKKQKNLFALRECVHTFQQTVASKEIRNGLRYLHCTTCYFLLMCLLKLGSTCGAVMISVASKQEGPELDCNVSVGSKPCG